MIASRQGEIPFCRGIGRQRGRGLSALAQVFGRTAILFCVNISSQLQNTWVLTFRSLMGQKLQMLLVVEKNQNSCKDCGKSNSEKNLVMVAGKNVQAESF